MRCAVLAAGVCAALSCVARAEGADRRERPRPPQGKELKAGDTAPDFELVLLPDDAPAEGAGDAAAKKDAGAEDARKDASAKPEKVRLSSFRGKEPVVLVLSSYT